MKTRRRKCTRGDARPNPPISRTDHNLRRNSRQAAPGVTCLIRGSEKVGEGDRHNGPPFGPLRAEESARARIIARPLGGAREHESERASERYGASFIHPTEWSLNLN